MHSLNLNASYCYFSSRPIAFDVLVVLVAAVEYTTPTRPFMSFRPDQDTVLFLYGPEGVLFVKISYKIEGRHYGILL